MGDLLSYYKISSNININALLYVVYNYAEIITIFFIYKIKICVFSLFGSNWLWTYQKEFVYIFSDYPIHILIFKIVVFHITCKALPFLKFGTKEHYIFQIGLELYWINLVSSLSHQAWVIIYLPSIYAKCYICIRAS